MENIYLMADKEFLSGSIDKSSKWRYYNCINKRFYFHHQQTPKNVHKKKINTSQFQLVYRIL